MTRTDLADNWAPIANDCGTGAGGFKSGNKCAGGGGGQAAGSPNPSAGGQGTETAQGRYQSLAAEAYNSFIAPALGRLTLGIAPTAIALAVPHLRSEATQQTLDDLKDVAKRIFTLSTLGTGPLVAAAVKAGIQHSPKVFGRLIKAVAAVARATPGAAAAAARGLQVGYEASRRAVTSLSRKSPATNANDPTAALQMALAVEYVNALLKNNPIELGNLRNAIRSAGRVLDAAAEDDDDQTDFDNEDKDEAIHNRGEHTMTDLEAYDCPQLLKRTLEGGYVEFNKPVPVVNACCVGARHRCPDCAEVIQNVYLAGEDGDDGDDIVRGGAIQNAALVINAYPSGDDDEPLPLPFNAVEGAPDTHYQRLTANSDDDVLTIPKVEYATYNKRPQNTLADEARRRLTLNARQQGEIMYHTRMDDEDILIPQRLVF